MGIHVSPKGKTGHEQRRVEAKMLKVLNQLEHKQLTVNEVKYVVNTVVGGVAQYTMRAIVLAPDMLKRIDTKIARVLKLKGKLGATANRNLLYLGDKDMGLGVVNMEETHVAIACVETLARLNDDTLVGQVARARLRALKESQGVIGCPLDKWGMEEAGQRRMGPTHFQRLQVLLHRKELEIRARDKFWNGRVGDSLGIYSILRKTHNSDWGLLGAS